MEAEEISKEDSVIEINSNDVTMESLDKSLEGVITILTKYGSQDYNECRFTGNTAQYEQVIASAAISTVQRYLQIINNRDDVMIP